MACGTEKDSVVAACVDVRLDRSKGDIKVTEICEAFECGPILNPRFSRYRVPRFRDIPRIDVHLVENRDIPPAGGGETPIIAAAPAIGNAIFAATGVRLRSMPLRGDALRKA